MFSCKSETKEKSSQTENKSKVSEQPAETNTPEIEILPISHATAVIKWDGKTIYLDPLGGKAAFAGNPKPDLVLITDIHSDHLSEETLKELQLENTKIIAPQAVKEELSKSWDQNLLVMKSGEEIQQQGFSITAIPMYNLREEAKKFHPKGRGNGYVLEKNGKRLYIAGDTEDIPEMRNLKNIDVALIPMNLPYTMTVETAADAVLDFAPKKVIPYHYRGENGFSDIAKFKQLVTKENPNIKVDLLDWYPNK